MTDLILDRRTAEGRVLVTATAVWLRGTSYVPFQFERSFRGRLDRLVTDRVGPVEVLGWSPAFGGCHVARLRVGGAEFRLVRTGPSAGFFDSGGDLMPDRKFNFGIDFADGPAAGVALTLGRAPLLLRAVHMDRKHGLEPWDALDMLDDMPHAKERIVVYRRVGDAGVCFVDYADKAGRRRGHRQASGTYRVVDPQPADADVRDTARWRAWCASVRAKEVGDGQA